MVSNVDTLENAGVLAGNLTDEQKDAINSLTEEEVETLKQIVQKVKDAGMSQPCSVSFI